MAPRLTKSKFTSRLITYNPNCGTRLQRRQMRLLKCGDGGEITLTNDLIDNIPPYAILSHTWGADVDEVSIEDIQRGNAHSKAAYRKISFCSRQAQEDGLHYFWIDTCCIDKANHSELSEAITSMYSWYQHAAKCYVYLSDVSAPESINENYASCAYQSAFRECRWFKRGWTLQELLAPRTVEFFTREEARLGDKLTLEKQIHETTSIPIKALRGDPLSNFTVGERMRWTAGRETKKKEDKAYCLLGIFDISMSLRYGEGDKAFARLENKVNRSSKYGEMIAWLAPARPEMLQAEIAATRHPGSGLSFIKGPLLSWLQGQDDNKSLMWVTAGSGKTTLFSLAVEKAKDYAARFPGTALAYHYCAFNDPDTQQHIDILGSLAAQFSAWHPGILEDLKRSFDSDQKRKQVKSLQVLEVEEVLVKHLANLGTVIVLIDALNESRDFVGTVESIVRLLQRLPKLKIMVTSTKRAVSAGIGQLRNLFEVGMEPSEDIQAFIEAKLSNHAALCHLSADYKSIVRATLLGNADQSFRWVSLTVDNLCRQRTGRAVMKALEQLPMGLYDTYANILGRISATDRQIAQGALMWLSFAKRPLTLIELSEAVVLEESDKTLNQDTRLHEPAIILEICHGLLEHDPDTDKVKLAHSSVREYLVSEYARNQDDSFFSLEASLSNQLMMRQCLTYLLFDDFRSGVASTLSDVDSRRRNFPLLDYAAHYWGQHASDAKAIEWSLAEKLFSTRNRPGGGNYATWTNCVYYETMIRRRGFSYSQHHFTKGLVTSHPLYFAASFGMAPVVQYLLSSSDSIDIERSGGRHRSTPLQVACFRGHKKVAEILLAAGADFWTQDAGSGEPAWFWAQVNGWTDLVKDMQRVMPEIVEMYSTLNPAQVAWAQRFQERAR